MTSGGSPYADVGGFDSSALVTHGQPHADDDPIGARIDRSIRGRDYLRGRVGFAAHPIGRKEWFHFCVLGPDIEALVNFSLCEPVATRTSPVDEVARLTVLAKDRAYQGDVETFPPGEVHARAGTIDLRFGSNRLVYRDGMYQVSFSLSDRAVAGDLLLRPCTVATMAPNIPLPDGPPLQWAIVPRLRAYGRVVIDDCEYRLDGAPTYHDHNWGRFSWGHRFSWIWGFCLPTSTVPWSVVFVRLANRARTCALAQGLFVWRGARVFRIFREHDLHFDTSGAFLRPARVAKIPGVMRLIAPDTATDVPRLVEIRADADGDILRLRFALEDLAQVVIPSETDFGVTIINEVTGTAAIDGVVRGERLEFTARGMCEFLGN